MDSTATVIFWLERTMFVSVVLPTFLAEAIEAHHATTRIRGPTNALVSRLRANMPTLFASAIALIVHIHVTLAHHAREGQVALFSLWLQLGRDDFVDALGE